MMSGSFRLKSFAKISCSVRCVFLESSSYLMRGLASTPKIPESATTASAMSFFDSDHLQRLFLSLGKVCKVVLLMPSPIPFKEELSVFCF